MNFQKNKMVEQALPHLNNSAFIRVYLRLFLPDNLHTHFSMKPTPASDSARFLTQLNDKL